MFFFVLRLLHFLSVVIYLKIYYHFLFFLYCFSKKSIISDLIKRFLSLSLPPFYLGRLHVSLYRKRTKWSREICLMPLEITQIFPLLWCWRTIHDQRKATELGIGGTCQS